MLYENNIPGFMSIKELETLDTIFAPYNKSDAIGIEIGSFLGRSSYQISKTIHNGKLYCIDSWGGWYTQKEWPEEKKFQNFPNKGTVCSLENFLKYTEDCKNIIPIMGKSPDIIQDWTQPIDFLFLDGLHTNPNDWDNISFWLPKIKRGGILSGHDYRVEDMIFPDIIANVNRLENILNQKVINPARTSIWYFVI